MIFYDIGQDCCYRLGEKHNVWPMTPAVTSVIYSISFNFSMCKLFHVSGPQRHVEERMAEISEPLHLPRNTPGQCGGVQKGKAIQEESRRTSTPHSPWTVLNVWATILKLASLVMPWVWWRVRESWSRIGRSFLGLFTMGSCSNQPRHLIFFTWFSLWFMDQGYEIMSYKIYWGKILII